MYLTKMKIGRIDEEMKIDLHIIFALLYGFTFNFKIFCSVIKSFVVASLKVSDNDNAFSLLY